MRIAVLHPYPVSGRAVGGVTRLHALVRHLAPRHRVTVLAHAGEDPASDAEAVRELAEIGVKQLLFPRPGAGAVKRLSWVLGRSPYAVAYNRNPGLADALASLEREEGLDAVHVELSYMAPFLARLQPRTVRILAEQETMSLALDRLRRVPFAGRTPFERYLPLEKGKVRRFEAEHLRSFQLLYGISGTEASWLAARTGRRVGILPHVVATRTFVPAAGEPTEPTVLFVGNFLHRPNLHGLTWFLESVWPGVRAAMPLARLEAVGPGLTEAWRREHERDGVLAPGRVENLVERYQQAAVFVNPIRTGGGMRGKVLEAFSCGRPVVSTPMGMEGIDAEPGRHHLEADEPRDFAGAVVRYLSDAGLRRAHGRAARELVDRLYDPSVVFTRLEDDALEAVSRSGR
ncbi:MAG: glycosyltransferase [Thermoanaerobaculia bacterium]|nr:glycosyltransferase [Thermoanaerobaculia bacterium]